MREENRKVMAPILALVTSGIGLLILLLIVQIINVRMLKSGYLEGSSVSSFVKVYSGIPLFILASVGWLAISIYSCSDYQKGVKDGSLIMRFLRLTSFEMYAFPVIVILYQTFFPLNMLAIDWGIIITGSLLGSLILYGYRTLEKKREVNDANR